MVSPRNRQRTPLEDRLLESAKEARTAASLVVPGREEDELLKRARNAECWQVRPTDCHWQIRNNMDFAI